MSYNKRDGILILKKKIKKEEPKIDILHTKELPDGGMEIEYEVNQAFVDLYLEQTGRKKFTKKGLNNWIIKLIRRHAEKELKHFKD